MSETAQPSREFQALLEFIKHSRGFDFTGYKSASLMRRISKRMETVKVKTFGDYIDYLEVDPEEFSRLFDTILINVTSFFRDSEAWDYLVQEALPKIIADKPADQPLRVWSAGCASGEEAYTLAVVLTEILGVEQFQERVKVYATDVDEDALTRARQGSYELRDLDPLPAELREKYFELTGSRYTFRADLRRAVIFGRHNLIQDAPISHLDLLVCRNALMYFNAETQSRVLTRFHFALNGKGLLFLGKAEMLLTHASLFTPVNLKHRIFSKVPQPGLRNHFPLLASAGNADVTNALPQQEPLRDAAFDAGLVAQIVVDLQGNMILANEQVRTLFNLSAKDLGRPFQDLKFSYRSVELQALLAQVMVTHRPASLFEIEWTSAAGESYYLNVEVSPLLDSEDKVVGTSISFIDVTRYQKLRQDLDRSTQELETAYEELQSTNEELETTNEELQSSVEELETTNEELQSSNEEMETMNEEIQSTNEELETINAELRERTKELDQANAFLESILTGIRTAVVVLDHNFGILTWSRRAEDLWGLRTDEVQGQSFLNLDTGLPVQSLKNCTRAVLAGQSEYEEVVLNATNRRGKAIQCRIICTPLRGMRKEVQGGILLMEEWEGQNN